MDKNLLIYQIKDLLFNPLITPSERLRLEPLLENISENDLSRIKSLLEKKISILNDVQTIFYDIRQSGEKVLDMEAIIKQSAMAHPFIDLTLENLTESIKNHLVDYLHKDLDLIKEIELYIQTQRDLLYYDGPLTFKVYDEIEFYKSILQAVRDCTQKFENKSLTKTIKSLINEYDITFPRSKYNNRAGFEEETFINQLNFEESTKSIARKVIALYDYLLEKIELLTEVNKINEEDSNQVSPNTEIDKVGTIKSQDVASLKSTPIILSKQINDAIREKPALLIKTDESITNSFVSSKKGEDVVFKKIQPSLTSPLIQQPQVLKSPKPALIFDIEDEKEADKHRDKAGAPPVLEHVLRVFVDEIINKNNLIFKDEVNKRRFIQLMVSRLKDVRGPLEVAEVLRKPSEAGGLGMTEEKADQVQAIIEQAKKEFELRIKHNELQIPEAIPEPVAPPAPVKIEPPKPAFDDEAAKQWRDQMLREIQAQTQSVAKTEANESPPVFKPQLLDVKAPPKVIGPLEELRSLTLVDFRRLGASPQEALQKIRGKIDLLGETSIARRLEAVRAWKSSVVYQQYLRLGRESIEQGKPISAIVASHQTLGEPRLTEEEFSAIADFNAKLRF